MSNTKKFLVEFEVIAIIRQDSAIVEIEDTCDKAEILLKIRDTIINGGIIDFKEDACEIQALKELNITPIVDNDIEGSLVIGQTFNLNNIIGINKLDLVDDGVLP